MELGSTAGKRGGQARGIQARGNQALGDRFHDNCKCVVAPVFVGDSYFTEVRQEHEAIYRENIVIRPDRTIDTRGTLAHIRAETGRR